jgi:hypothetical protein
MNVIAAIGVYAAVLKERGEPLYYPGEGGAMLEATDTGIIAQCCEWAAESPAAKNQCFNLTNGEFSSFKEEWPLIASCLGMEVGEQRQLSFRTALPAMAADWDRVREKHGLVAPTLDTFLGQSTQFSDFIFARKATSPSSISCIKVRRSGFSGMMYTDDMLKKWFRLYQHEKLLPPS